ncbi:MAG: anthranilate phosphoribosyltransferase [Verrucomicrobiota bacterium JB022]|nr:anthranilate phosphoribosyltransferase [Verrucomicrobiota bacterium JB022]
MDMLLELTQQVRQGVDLERAQVAAVAQALASADADARQKEDFLAALHAKGETVAEITAFAGAFREMALDPGLESWRERGIDIVGTGGSGIGGYNISSVSAIVTAAAGVPVLKHGGRAVTSKSGAADFLTVLGLPIQSDPAKLQASVEQLNFCFFFAPAFHPAFKEIVPVRKALAAKGQRTIFNILGPLINPARPQRQLLGVSRADLIEPLADALTILGLTRGYAVGSRVVGDKIMDEFSTAGDNLVAGIGQLKDQRGTWTPEEQGFARAELEELCGGTPEENLVLFQQILDGQGRPGLIDTICHNAGAALFIAEAVPNLPEGYALARELLLGGKVAAWVAKAQAFYRELV